MSGSVTRARRRREAQRALMETTVRQLIANGLLTESLEDFVRLIGEAAQDVYNPALPSRQSKRVSARPFAEKVESLTGEQLKQVALCMDHIDHRYGRPDSSRVKRMVGLLRYRSGVKRLQDGTTKVYDGLGVNDKTVTEDNAIRLCDALGMDYKEVGL